MSCFVAKPVSPERLAAALSSVANDGGAKVFHSPRQSARARRPVRADPLAAAVRDLGEERAASLAALFLETLGADLHLLRTAAEAGDLTRCASLAHRMKGAAGNFDLGDLVACLNRVESFARDAARTELQDELPKLAACAAEATAAIAIVLGDMGATQAAQ